MPEVVIAIASVAELFLTILMALWIRSIDGKTKTIDAQNDRIDGLEEALKNKTEQLVDVRFAHNTMEFSTRMASMQTDLRRVLERLEKGDREFKEDDEARHKLELEVFTKMV